MGKETSYVFDFLVTKAPSGYGSFQNTIQHFDVISSTLVFLDGAAAGRSDLAVGQKVTVYLEVLPGGGFNAVAKRVMAYSGTDTGAGSSSRTAALAGNTFVYVQRLPKDSGWHSAKPKENTVMVKVFSDGKTVQIRWLFWTGTGCGGVDTGSGRRYSYPVGVGMVTTLNSNGTFHVVDTRPFMPGTRFHRSEVYGEFAADGSYVKLRLRQKLDVITPSSRFRCDGRWVSLRVPSRRGGSSSAPAPKPTPSLYEAGRYKGEVVYAVVYDSQTVVKAKGAISFTVVLDASGHGSVHDVEFQVQIGYCPKLRDRQGEAVTERLAKVLPIDVGQFDINVTTSQSGDRVGFHGQLKGRTAKGELGVDWEAHTPNTPSCSTHDGTSYGPVPWSASKVST